MSACIPLATTREAIEQYVLEDLRRTCDDGSSGGLSWEDGDGYVQWALYGDHVQLEISSPRFMVREYSPQEQQALRFLGFEPPGPASDLPNYWQQFATNPVGLEQATTVALACLYELLAGHEGAPDDDDVGEGDRVVELIDGVPHTYIAGPGGSRPAPDENYDPSGGEAVLDRQIEGVPGPAVVLRIGALFDPGMNEDDVYDAVRGWWRIGAAQRDRIQYVVAVANGVVRGVYLVHNWVPRKKGDRGWQQDAPGKPKWGFNGEPAMELANLVGTDVAHLFRQGAANPVTYVNS